MWSFLSPKLVENLWRLSMGHYRSAANATELVEFALFLGSQGPGDCDEKGPENRLFQTPLPKYSEKGGANPTSKVGAKPTSPAPRNMTQNPRNLDFTAFIVRNQPRAREVAPHINVATLG
jgi:hypothetical protein